jgi:hypothetical protein
LVAVAGAVVDNDDNEGDGGALVALEGNVCGYPVLPVLVL